MSRNLTGFVCIVTGATRGIGKAVAIALGEAGATVYITGRSFDSNGACSLKETARIIEDRGGKPVPVALDHSDDNQVAGLFARIRREQFGRLDILINNASSAGEYLLSECTDPGSVYWESTVGVRGPSEEWDLMNRVSLRNSYTCCVLATRMMVECRAEGANAQPNHISSNRVPTKLPTGLIVNVSSIGGTWRIFNVAFCAGKSALNRMSLEMARDLAKRNVDVVVVSLLPGLVRTEMISHLLESADVPSFLQKAVDIRMDIPPELPGQTIVKLAEQPNKTLLSYSGRTLFLADLASRFRLRKPDGSYPRNPRSVKTMLQLTGWPILAYFVPAFVKVPFWVLTLMTSKF